MTSLLSTRQCDVEESALFLQFLPRIAHHRGEEIFLQPYDKYVRELQSLCRVDGHQRDAVLIVARLVLVGHQRDLAEVDTE